MMCSGEGLQMASVYRVEAFRVIVKAQKHC